MIKPTGKEPTAAQIRKFVKVRSKSGLNSNLQFSFDAGEAGFNAADLPEVVKVSDGEWLWHLSHGTLREFFGM